MRSRTLVLLLVAVLLAGGTALLARSWLAAQRSRDVSEAAPVALPTPAKSVLVARNDIKRGQILRAEDMVWQQWPEGGIDRNYIVIGTKTPENYAGWVAQNPISAGEPVTEQKIISPGSRGFLAAVLRPGMRAISVPVTAITGISGFIFPGDQVDLMITYTINQPETRPGQNGGGTDHKVAETVLHDLRVIAIDQRMDSKPGEALVAHTATLEVTPKESEIIALAAEMGKLSLTLRSLSPDPSATLPKLASSETTKVAATDGVGDDQPKLGDSSNPLNSTYTVDSDVSALVKPLVPLEGGKKGSANNDTITILRGGGKGSESVATDSGQKGS